MANDMALVLISIPMEMSSGESGRTMRRYMDFTDSKTDLPLRAGLNTTTSAMELWSTRMVNLMRASSKMERDMDRGLTAMQVSRCCSRAVGRETSSFLLFDFH